MTDEELRRLHREAETELKKLPNVVAVGLGLKERGGTVTDEVALRVYVSEKKAPSQLKPEEVIPASYKGVPTDVLLQRFNKPEECEDHDTHSPLIGGISISTFVKDKDDKYGTGTLGLFATINGAAAPHNIACISNHHVLADHGEPVGQDVYQPPFLRLPDGTWALDSSNKNPIGTLLAKPPKADHPYTYQGEAQAGYFVDCASVKLNICISSWCNTNCGVSFANEIRGLNVNGGNAITDVARARIGDIVYKVGRSTSRTVGRVVDVALEVTNPDGSGGHNNIEVQALGADCNGIVQFSDSGDSGAAYINAQGQVVGLHHGHDSAHLDRSHGSHIHPILDALGLTAITKAHPVHGNPAASGMLSDMPAEIHGRPNHTARLRSRFLDSDEGRRIAAEIEIHRHEVVHLVNHNRRVTVAWHRLQGPGFLNRAINNARDPEILIPRELEGVSRQALLQGMAQVLTTHGTPALGVAIRENLEEILTYAEAYDSLHDLVDTLTAKKSA